MAYVARLRIGIVQMNVALDIRANSDKILRNVKNAKSRKIDLLCFPECALTGYIRDHRQVDADAVFSKISKLQEASDFSGVTLVVGSSLPWKDRIYNTALIIRPHRRIRKYFKRTLTDYDKKYFSKGATFNGFCVNDISCGVLICRDQDDPSLPKRFKKASVLFYLSSHHYKTNELEYKERKNKAFPIVRAIENKIYVAKADAVGIQGGRVSVGSSMIVDPRGAVIAEAPRKKEAMLELNL